MILFKNIGVALGGITLFLLGLKFMSESMEELTGSKMKTLLRGLTSNKVAGVITGAISTAVIQSSVATNVILVGLTSSGIISFYQASSVIMGANIRNFNAQENVIELIDQRTGNVEKFTYDKFTEIRGQLLEMRNALRTLGAEGV